MFSHNHFAENYLKYAQINSDSIPLCAPVGTNFEGIKAKSVQKMQFCYVRGEGEKMKVGRADFCSDGGASEDYYEVCLVFPSY